MNAKMKELVDMALGIFGTFVIFMVLGQIWLHFGSGL